MFDSIINLISMVVATAGIGACLGVMLYEVRKKPGVINYLLVTIMTIATLKCGQYNVWAVNAVIKAYSGTEAPACPKPATLL